MNNLSNNVPTPLYRQLYDEILSKINSGEYKIGDKIPSESQLSKMYGISRITVRNGIQKLCDDNILVKKHGKGTFVSMPVYVESISSEGSFTKSCIQMGKTPSTKVIAKGLKKSEKNISESLGIKSGENILYINRLRFIDGIATIYEEDYFNKEFEFMLNADSENVPLLEIIRTHTGYSAVYFDNVVDIKYSNKKESEYLNCSIGTPLLVINQTVIGEKNQIIYFNTQAIRSDIYKYTFRSMYK